MAALPVRKRDERVEMERLFYRPVLRDVPETAAGLVRVYPDGRSPRMRRIGFVQPSEDADGSRYEGIMGVDEGYLHVLPFDDAIRERRKYEAGQSEGFS